MKAALLNSRKPVRLAMAGIAAILLSGCADSSGLVNPYSNPFHSSDRYDHQPTGTIDQPHKSATQKVSDFFAETFRPFGERRPAARQRPRADDFSYNVPRPPASIQSQPLSPPGAVHDPYAVNSATPAYSAPAYSAPSYTPPAPIHTASEPRYVESRVGGWTSQGGTPVIVRQGEDARIIAQRYGVPTETLLRLNGYGAEAQVRPGSRLVIPVYHANIPRHSVAARPKPMHSARLERHRSWSAAKPARDVAERDDAARRAEMRARQERARAEAEARKLAAAREAAKRAEAEAKHEAARLVAHEKHGRNEKAQVADRRHEIEAAQKVAAAQPAATAQHKRHAAETTASLPHVASAAHDFRWPARGRIIRAFGSNGNDGINIALPEGTQVKAVDNGVVAYAGSELKGYGNLVLIRHPNGFVSAYANNEKLKVKRGQEVKRGQVIALSGDTGNVASPQLHFELRKGSRPVNPTSYLAGL